MFRNKLDVGFIIRNFIYSIIIFTIVTIQIRYATGPVIMPDEVGYWAAGATMSGLNWSGVMYMSPYYGYGYGFILSLLFKVFSDPVKMFQGAIVINAILLVSIYWLCYNIIKIIAFELSDRLKSLLSFVVTVYSFNIYYSQNSEAEILQIAVYLLTCLLLLQCSSSSKKFEWRMILLSMVSIYLLACHLRNVAVVFVLCLTAFILLLSKKISLRSFVGFAIGLIVSIIIFLQIKSYMNANLYSVTKYTGDEAARVQGALGVFSISGIKSFLINVCGRLFYIGCATFLIGYRGIWFTGCALIKSTVCSIKKRAFDIENDSIFKLFILFSLLAEITIGSLSFLGNESRIDGFLYGRYSEHVLIPILIYGFISIEKTVKSMKIQLMCSITLFLQAMFMNYVYIINHAIESSTHSIVGILGFFICNNIDSNNIQFIYSLGIAIFGSLIAWIIYIMLQCTSVDLQFAGMAFTALCWVVFSINALHNYFFSFAEYNKDLYSFAEEVDSQTASPMYYLIDKDSEVLEKTSSTWLMYRIQYFLPNEKISVIDIDELSNQDFVMVYKYSSENQKVLNSEKYSVIIEGERLALYKYNN